MDHPIATKIADTAACLSLGTCAAGFVEQVTPFLQFLALSIAVISGTCAAYYHIKLIKKLP